MYVVCKWLVYAWVVYQFYIWVKRYGLVFFIYLETKDRRWTLWNRWWCKGWHGGFMYNVNMNPMMKEQIFLAS